MMIKETAGAKYIRELLGGDLSLFANPNDMVRAVYKKIAPKDKKSPLKIDPRYVKKILAEQKKMPKALDFDEDIIPCLTVDQKELRSLMNNAYSVARAAYVKQDQSDWPAGRRRTIRPPSKALIVDLDNVLTHQINQTIQLIKEINQCEDSQTKNDLYKKLDPLLIFLPTCILDEDDNSSSKSKKINPLKADVRQEIITRLERNKIIPLFQYRDPSLQRVLTALPKELIAALIVKDGVQSGEITKEKLSKGLKDLQQARVDKVLIEKVQEWLKHPAVSSEAQNIPSRAIRGMLLADYLWYSQDNSMREEKRALEKQIEAAEMDPASILFEMLVVQSEMQDDKIDVYFDVVFGPKKSKERLHQKLSTRSALKMKDHDWRGECLCQNFDEAKIIHYYSTSNPSLLQSTIQEKRPELDPECGYGPAVHDGFSLPSDIYEAGTRLGSGEWKIIPEAIHCIQLHHGGDSSYNVSRGMGVHIKQQVADLTLTGKEKAEQEAYLHRQKLIYRSVIDGVSRWTFELGQIDIQYFETYSPNNPFAAKHQMTGEYADPVYFLYVMVEETVKALNAAKDNYHGGLLQHFLELSKAEVTKLYELSPIACTAILPQRSKNTHKRDVKIICCEPCLDTKDPLKDFADFLSELEAKKPGFLCDELRQAIGVFPFEKTPVLHSRSDNNKREPG